eukprot:c28684_g2_i1 orf=329-2023(+)
MEHRSATVAGSQSEHFFDLLHPNTSLASPTFSATQNGPKNGDGSTELNYGGDDLLPNFDFQSDHNAWSTKVVTGTSDARGEEYFLSGGRGRPLLPPSPAYSYEAKVYSSSEPIHTYEATNSKPDKELYNSVTVAAVERTMKKYADNLLQLLEGMGGRLSQLESTIQRLEHSLDGLRAAEAHNHSETDGRLRRLENLLKEVQTGVQVIHTKQETIEAQSNLLKLQLSNTPSSATTNASASDGLQQAQKDVRHQSMEQSLSVPHQHQFSQVPLQVHPPAALQQPQPQPQPIPASISNEPVQTPMQHQLPPAPGIQQQALPHLQSPPSQSSMQMPPFYSQQSQLQQVPQGTYAQHVEVPSYSNVAPHVCSLSSPPSGNYSSELPPYASGNYAVPPPRPLGPNQQSLPRYQLPPQTSQQQGHGGPQMYESTLGRAGSGPVVPYLPQSQSVPYETQTSGYGSPYRVGQPVPSAPSGGGGYPRLPAAQPIQHALPTASSGGGSSGGTPLSSNRVPVEEVIEKVATMGFSKDQVRAVVRHLTENGQSVDLNIVLDKLMNGEVRPQTGWFGR